MCWILLGQEPLCLYSDDDEEEGDNDEVDDRDPLRPSFALRLSFELQRPWQSQASKPDPTSKLAATMASSYSEHSQRSGQQWAATNKCQKSFGQAKR
ncbi:hypothetical protein NL676_033777 [Syzygium grande]|nr:hypothetical protein NL676_033777 [Syzygium grande]